MIENYPGFPEGIPGEELLGKFVQQADKFNAEILCPQKATGIRADGEWRIIQTEDGEEYAAKMIILSLGLSYRHLTAEGLGSFMGRGVWYGVPAINPLALEECVVSIVGGANSAGQAAMDLARNPKVKVKLLVRRSLDAQMSQYLVDRINKAPNIEVMEGVEVSKVMGTSSLEAVGLKGEAGEQELATQHLFIFIGANPKTNWLNGEVEADEKKFLLTGPNLVLKEGIWREERPPLYFETNIPGVFACGDVRLGSIKRVGAAVGEGIATLATCHEFWRLTH
jgi:thioredoxin reductase (NADPH)